MASYLLNHLSTKKKDTLSIYEKYFGVSSHLNDGFVLGLHKTYRHLLNVLVGLATDWSGKLGRVVRLVFDYDSVVLYHVTFIGTTAAELVRLTGLHVVLAARHHTLCLVAPHATWQKFIFIFILMRKTQVYIAFLLALASGLTL